jgi:hypothetical protein
MTDTQYDPSFDQTKRPKPDHECLFVQTANRFIETCSLPGCHEGRISRGWISHMQKLHVREAHH